MKITPKRRAKMLRKARKAYYKWDGGGTLVVDIVNAVIKCLKS